MNATTLANALTPDSWLDVALRLLVAMAIGAACGWDREREGRAAGLRTFMMVCLGAAAFTVIGLELIDHLRREDQAIGYDPSRIVAGIVTGIGFLGAGTIIQSGGKVKGLTTAAGLWVVASAGIAAGSGLFVLAGTIGAATLFVLVLMRTLEDRWVTARPGDERPDAKGGRADSDDG